MTTRRRKKILAFTLLGTLCLLGVLRIFLDRIVWSQTAAVLRDTYGLDASVKDLSISLINGRATVRELRITEGGAPLFRAEELLVSVSIRKILAGDFDFGKIIVTRPVFRLALEEAGGTNIGRIFKSDAPTGAPAPRVFFEEARVIDGRFELDDAETDRKDPARLVLDHIEVSINELQIAGEPGSPDLGDMRLDLQLRQKGEPASMSLVAWAPPLTDKLTIAVHAAITGLDLEQLPQYVTTSTRQALGGDVIHLVGTMSAAEGVIKEGAIKAGVPASGLEIPMRFGGTTSEIVFDRDSKLSALFQLPFARLGHMGDVALTSTWGAARDVGSGVVGAGAAVAGGVKGTLGSMAALDSVDPLGALQSAGGGIVGGVGALGSGLIHGTKRVFRIGGDKEATAKNQVQQALEFRALHERCRSAMLAAALASTDDTHAARRRRIEHELELAKPAAVESEAK